MTAAAYTFFIIFSTATILLISESHTAFISKRMQSSLNARERIIDPKKRPFCNAFTGCGRKRSNLPALNNQGEVIDESLGSLLELNAEPAVEDLSRQIMSEAKLWEAIQEANMELNRRRLMAQQESAANSSPEDDNVAPVPARSATASCALPPCYI